ncbi:MAG: hypothetical protein CSB47_00175 [Proteobacteria bacterium]|nr:MAG: hypothetical protein CSB47_00175 [Pseudomonadota bacterium]
MAQQYTFPWGVYIGELSAKSSDADSPDIPVLSPAEAGGFRVDYDEFSEVMASDFIENALLLLAEALPAKALQIHVFDFATAPRFRYLSQLRSYDAYRLYGNSKMAQNGFDHIEELAKHRLHELLPPEVQDLSEYNQTATYPEAYHVLLINLDDYPDDFSGFKRIKSLFHHASKAGIYTILYGSDVDTDTESNRQRVKSLDYLAERFAPLTITDKQFILSEALFGFAELQDYYDFLPVECNKSAVLAGLTERLNTQQQDNTEADFLQVPIAKSQDGRQDIYFSLGATSQNYHAIITGGTGSGKSVLLNNLIVGIAERYTAQEIQLYLMDYKGGIEFNVFRDHPNCVRLFLDASDFSLAADMVAEFVDEQNQRRELMKQANVKNIAAYNKVNPYAPLAHKLLIIDEAHRLFAGSYKQQAHFLSCLNQITRQGRSDGLHVILITQTLAGSDIPKDLLGQIPLRLSFKLNEAKDAWALFEHGNTAALYLDKQKYEVLINTDRGIKQANLIALANPPLAPEEQELEAIRRKMQQIRASRAPQQCLIAEVIRGKAHTEPPAPTIENPFIEQQQNTSAPDWLITEDKQ